MKLPDSLNRMFLAPKLTWTRIILALAIAVFADGLQFCLGFVGWAFIDQAIDCVAMILVSWAIGFHILLLPTFVVELVPVWMICRRGRPAPLLSLHCENANSETLRHRKSRRLKSD